MASIDDVARRAGVSAITVSRVMRQHPNVREETRRRVMEAASELHYVPNAIARGLKQSRSELIALIVTDVVDPFFSVVTRGVEDAARRAGMMLILGNSDNELAMEAEYLRVMEEHRVAGIILVPASRMPGVSLPPLPRRTPLVILDRALPGIDADVVRCDTATGTRTLCAHLIELGRRSIAIVGGAPHSSTWQERVDGFQSALLDAGLAVRSEFIIAGNYRADSGVAAVRALMHGPDQPDAIIAANGKVVRGVLDELVSLGCRIPDDVAVAAIDDPFPDSKFWPSLTVVEQPGYEMGKMAVELLASRLPPISSGAPWREIVFDSVLRLGQTCGEHQHTASLAGVSCRRGEMDPHVSIKAFS